MLERETIFALASGHAIAGVSVVRISGPESWNVISCLTRRELPAPRMLSRRWLYGSGGTQIDDSLVVLFSDGASFTGERVAEIHCHGSRAVVEALLSALRLQPHCRDAVPGEFTRRAFESGRIDLNEVEGLSDLLKAETEFQRSQAIRVMSGATTDRVDEWRNRLIRARALIEVTIDWADEDVPEDVSPEVLQIIKDVTAGIEADLEKFARTEKLREGFEVAIVGRPNAGKSTLLNAIAGREVAITSDVAGTTRDVLEVRCDLGGLPVIFLDTAGLRETDDRVERIGVDLATRRAEAADLRVFLHCIDAEPVGDELKLPDDILAWSKADIAHGDGEVVLSAKSGQGVGTLIDLVQQRLLDRADNFGVFGHRRQEACLKNCHSALVHALRELSIVDPEVLAEHLRNAIAELDSLSGRSAVEDMLGEVFSSFCLGK